MRLRSGVGAVLDRRLEVAMKVRLEPAPVRGFRFAGVCAGLRNEPGRKDLGLIAADRPVTAAGVFTTNRVKAAPVIVSQERVRRGQLQAVTANSGSANCFTGKAGLKLAHDSAAAVARAIGCSPELVAPCSTGVIGRTYDLVKYRAGVAAAIAALRRALARALPQSFNAITVDGDMSTNDTLLLMASGAAGNRTLAGRDLAAFEAAVAEVSSALAHELVRDGEGATKLVTVEVRGARTHADADRVARQIANSPLVKTAFFGCDPNFGRILMAQGKAGGAVNPDRSARSV